MSTPTRVFLVMSAIASLACGSFMEGVEQGFNEGFDKSFKESFVTSCMAERGPELDEATFRAICTCSADAMLVQYSASELMSLSTEAPAEIERRALPIVEKCATDVMMAGGAAAAPASQRAPGQ